MVLVQICYTFKQTDASIKIKIVYLTNNINDISGTIYILPNKTPIQIYFVNAKLSNNDYATIAITNILFTCQEDGLHAISLSFDHSFIGTITCKILYI